MHSKLSNKELKIFIKNNYKTILTSIFISTFLFLLFFIYNSYVNNRITDYEEDVITLSDQRIESILSKEPEDISKDEFDLVLNNLEHEQVYFDFYIENEDQSSFTNTSLIKEILVSSPVIDSLENTTEQDIFPNKHLGVNVRKSTIDNAMSVVISTGDFDRNMAISQDYLTLLTQEDLELLQDREVHILSEEPAKIEVPFNDRLGENISIFSWPLGITMMVLGMLVGLLVGILMSIGKIYKSDKVNVLYNFIEEENDTVIDIVNIQDKTDNNIARVYPIIFDKTKYPKLVICESLDQFMDKDDKEILEKKIIEDGNIISVNDVSEFYGDVDIKEVTIIVRMNSTSKNWYQSQRIQLKRTKSPVTIVLI